MDTHILTGVPLLDIILNVDWFTVHFDDRKKIVTIIIALFYNSKTFKQLMYERRALILSVLLNKYDKKCHMYFNSASK